MGGRSMATKKITMTYDERMTLPSALRFVASAVDYNKEMTGCAVYHFKNEPEKAPVVVWFNKYTKNPSITVYIDD